MLEERYAGIEHQNRLLLSRMSDIMMRAEGDGAKAGAGGIDNVSTAWQYGRSLNTRNRKKELSRIMEDNKVRDGGDALARSAAARSRALTPIPDPAPPAHPRAHHQDGARVRPLQVGGGGCRVGEDRAAADGVSAAADWRREALGAQPARGRLADGARLL